MLTIIISKTLFVTVLVILRNDPLLAAIHVHVLIKNSHNRNNKPRGQLKCDGIRAETRFRLLAKRTSPFKSAGGRQFSRLLAALCASAVIMLDTPCSEVVWRVLSTHSIRQFPLHFPSRASPCVITFQLESNTTVQVGTKKWFALHSHIDSRYK